jgi:hypothetical protein
MIATAPQLGSTGWFLVGKPDGGGTCDHCGRNLKHCYLVVSPDRAEMTVGRGCVKVLTGWTLSASEANRLLWLAEREIVHVANWAAFTAAHPELAARIDADCDDEEGTPKTVARTVRFDISDGDIWGSVQAFAEGYVRRAGVR